jgi:hypothetical protein
MEEAARHYCYLVVVHRKQSVLPPTQQVSCAGPHQKHYRNKHMISELITYVQRMQVSATTDLRLSSLRLVALSNMIKFILRLTWKNNRHMKLKQRFL